MRTTVKEEVIKEVIKEVKIYCDICGGETIPDYRCQVGLNFEYYSDKHNRYFNIDLCDECGERYFQEMINKFPSLIRLLNGI